MRRKSVIQAPVSEVHTIDTLTISGFIRCLFRSDLSAMTKSGIPSEIELKSAWMQLFEKYCQLIESPQYGEIEQIYRNILKYSSWIIAVETFVKVLYLKRSDEAIQGLQMLGYDFPFPADDHEQYLKNLKSVQTRLKAIHVRLKDESNKLKAFTDKAAAATQRDDETEFMDNVAVLSRFVGFHIDTEKISVAVFAAYQRQYQRFLRHKEMKDGGKN